MNLIKAKGDLHLQNKTKNNTQNWSIKILKILETILKFLSKLKQK